MKRLGILLAGALLWLGLVDAVGATRTKDTPQNLSWPAAAAGASSSAPMLLADRDKDKKPKPTPAPAPSPISPGSPYRLY
jgi:hypothetical protein